MKAIQERLSIQEHSKILLLFCKAQRCPVAALSLNIIREVAAYLDTPQCFVTISESSVFFHFFNPDERLTTTIETTIQAAKSYCMIPKLTLLIVGGPSGSKQVIRLDLVQLQVLSEGSMLEGRSWPGICRYQDHVFVFGGNTSGMLKSAEKYTLQSKTWTPIAPMQYARVYFTPCKWRDEIYLPSVDTTAKPVEVYQPQNDTYRVLRLMLQDQYYGSVSYIVNGELLHLTYSQRLGKWKVDSQDTTLQLLGTQVKNKQSALSNCPPQRFGDFLVWPNCEGRLTKLDLQAFTLSEH